MKLLTLLFVCAVLMTAQVPIVPNTDSPTLRVNLNVSLQNAVSLSGNYVNPAWIGSLAWSKISNPPSFEVPLAFVAPVSRTVNTVTLTACGVDGQILKYRMATGWTCEADLLGTPGGGITTINGLTPTTQAFAAVSDANMTLAIGSLTSTHTFTLTWAGVLSKIRQHGATVYSDQTYTDAPWLSFTAAGGRIAGFVPTASANLPNGYLKLDGAGNAVVGAPVPATAPPTGSLNFQGNIYQNGVLFGGGAGITLTTTGTSGAATLAGGALNIPQYAAGGSMIYPAAPGVTIAGSGAWGTSVALPADPTKYLNGAGAFTVPAGGLPPSTVTVEQFGAVGDGVTDDTAAIQAAINSISAGTVLFAAKTYKTSAVINVTTSNLNLLGHGPRASILKSTATTGDVVKFSAAGAGNCSGGIIFSTMKGIGLQRTTPATAGTGLNITNGCWIDVQDVESFDSISGFYLVTSGNTLIQRSQAYWTTSSALPRYGYHLDDSGSGNMSTRIKHAGVAGTGSNITGLYVHGTCIADLFVDDFETAFVDYGVNISSSTNPSTWTYCNGDLHINHPVFDQTQIAGILINGVYGGGSANISINDAFIDGGTNNAIAIDIEGSQGVAVNGGQLHIRGNAGIGVKIAGANSGNNKVTGAKIDFTTTGVLLSGTSNNIVSANTFSSIASAPSTTHIALVGATNNVVLGNVLSGYATTGISLDASSGTNKVYPNSIDPLHITTAITNLAAGNDTGGWTVSSCQPGLGDGLNAIPAGTYLQSGCLNDTGVPLTITGIKCLTDNAGTSTMNVTNGANTALLTTPLTCSSTFAVGTQSATVTIAAGDYAKFIFASDGATKQTTWTLTESR